jgi:hypothetical protein
MIAAKVQLSKQIRPRFPRGPFLYGTRRTSGRATIVGHIVTTVAAVELPTVVGGYCDTPSIA